MKIDKENLLNSILESLDNLEYIKSADIPNIDLYMDQVTTFLDTRLRTLARNPGQDKVMTKTMINNYAKNDLLPPPVKKKYSKEHVLLLIFIYYYKGILSINDIQTLLRPITEKYFQKDGDFKLEQIYEEVFSLEKGQIEVLKKEIIEEFQRSEQTFADVGEEDKDLRVFDFSSMSDKHFSMEGVVDAIDAVMAMCPLEDDIIVYRGFNNPRMLGFEEKEEVIDASLTGDVSYTEHGYMSTSAVCGGRFINECPYVMAIRLPKGTNVCYLNNDVGLMGEVEVLVQRGCEVVVTDSEIIDGKCIMYGTVVSRDIEPKDVSDISICEDDAELERIANYCNDGGDDYMTDIDVMFDELDSFELDIDSNEKGI